MSRFPSETNEVLDKICYLFQFNRLTPRPEVGANSRLAKVHSVKSGPAMRIGSAAPVELTLTTQCRDKLVNIDEVVTGSYHIFRVPART